MYSLYFFVRKDNEKYENYSIVVLLCMDNNLNHLTEMRKYIMFACTLLLLAGCSKNEIIIYGSAPENGESGHGESSNDSEALITFSASLESRKVTRSMSPMPKGLASQVYAFKTADSNFREPLAEGLYTTSSAGLLTGLDGYKMFLSNGTYNMYAFSKNSSTYPPDITNGVSAPLKNGVDYLWWESLQQDIMASQIQMPIVFQHVASQVVIDLSAGEGLKLDSLVSATILPPTPGASLDLRTGIIEATTTYDTTPLNMGKNGFLAQVIVLPTRATSPMSMTLKVLADGETTPRTYTAAIPIPGKLAGGFSYVFSAIIDGNSVSFPNVSIKDWTEVDESGNPIYPIQK